MGKDTIHFYFLFTVILSISIYTFPINFLKKKGFINALMSIFKVSKYKGMHFLYTMKGEN